ncbi:hypothetical protein E0K83_10465 [Gramella sp. BOM4]|nr:hypothetical protein [Christiangramia bathymodioli]
MKRIHLVLVAIIFISISAKVSVAPDTVEYPVLSGKEELNDHFIEYRVKDIHMSLPNHRPCTIKLTKCCNA